MINFGAKNTLNTSVLQVKPVGAGMSNMTIPFGNSAGDSQTPEITCTAAECMDASGRCHVNMSTQKNKTQSLEEYVQDLKKQGKIEGKDFKIEGSPLYDNYNLYEYDEQGREVKVNYWCSGNQASDKSGYDLSEYKNGVRIDKSYTNDGYLRMVDERYPNVREEDAQEAKLLDTNPDDYCKYLESQGKVKNKDYKVEKQIMECSDGTKQVDVFIDELSPRGVRQKGLWWIFSDYGTQMSVSYCDENGKERTRKNYNSDGTSSVTHYTKDFRRH